MLVRYRVSGGLAPVFWGCDLDTTTMTDEEARALETLVEGSGLMNPRILPHIRGADTRTYVIDVRQPGTTRSLTIDTLQVWAELRPLIGFLDAHAEDQFSD